jgi:hypothetical protein
MFDRPVYNMTNGQDASSADLYPVIYQTSGTVSKLADVNGFAAPCAVCQAPPTAEFMFTNVGRYDCMLSGVRFVSLVRLCDGTM